MGKGQKLVTKKAPVEGSEDLFQNSQAIYSSSEEDDDVQIQVGEDDDDLTQIDDSQRREDSQRLEESTPTAPEPEILRPQRPQEPPKKRQRHYHMIGDQHEEGVVEWYRQHELLYNKKMRAYRDRDKKSQAWTTKAEELGVEVNTLQTWITNMRTRYAKLMQTTTGQEAKDLTERDQWIKESFAFLRPHIVRCVTRTSKKSDGHRPDQQVASPGTSQGTSQVDDPQSTSPLPPMPPPERPVSAASATSNELLEKLEQAEDRHRQLLEKAQERAENVPTCVLMIRNVHTLVQGALGDLGMNLTTYYVNETVKFMSGIINHVHHGAPLPRYPMGDPNPPVAGPSHVQNPPPAHASRRQSAPPTPKHWQSNRPTYGRPEATAVTPRQDYLDMNMSHEFSQYFASLDHNDM